MKPLCYRCYVKWNKNRLQLALDFNPQKKTRPKKSSIDKGRLG